MTLLVRIQPSWTYFFPLTFFFKKNNHLISAGKIVPGPGFFWDDLYKTRSIKMFNIAVTVPEPMQQYLFLIMNAVLYAILAWYFDNVLPGTH